MNNVSTRFFDQLWSVQSQFVLARAIYVISKLNINGERSDNLKRVLSFLESSGVFHDKMSDSLRSSIIEDQNRNWTVLKSTRADKEKFLDALAPHSLDKGNEIAQKSRGYILSRALFGALELKLPELLREEAHLEQLASQTGASLKGLSNLLYQLCFIGVVQNSEKGFRLTEKGQLLLDPGVQAFILHEDEDRWLAAGMMEEVVMTGKRYFQNQDYFQELAKNNEKLEISDIAMSFITDYENPAIIPILAKILKPGMTVVDIGGGQGKLLSALLKECPEVKGILFDMPATVARHRIPEELQKRCEIVGGDFFKEIPAGDVYLIKRVLHDWNDADCEKILANCKRSMKPGGRVVLNEMLLPNADVQKIDILMMNIFDSAERNLGQFRALLGKAQLQLLTFEATATWLSVMIAG